MSREEIIVFTRDPVPGKTKTRLIGVLDEREAADLQRGLTATLLVRAKNMCDHRGTGLIVAYEGVSEQKMQRQFGVDLVYRQQHGADLGQRLANALAESFAAGAKKTLVVGSDVPGIKIELLTKALDALAKSDMVIGPAHDGGYYLLGLKCDTPQLFEGIEWGSADVFDQTMAIARQAGLQVAVLDTLHDLDRPEDLRWYEAAAATKELRDVDVEPLISVVIPALNEARLIEATIEKLLRADAVKIIVADGGSDDGTRTLAERAGARVIECAPGRAGQMNAGASAASGDILLFCHADTLMPVGYDALVRRTLAAPKIIAGAFSFRVDSKRRGLRVVEALADFRSRKMHMPYGDQSLFLRKSDFMQLGGFPDLPIMEDFEFVRQLKRKGEIAIVESAAVTSDRRWQKKGVLKTTLVNQGMIVGYWLGIKPRSLAQWYRGK
jgi:uncharacterized protein